MSETPQLGGFVRLLPLTIDDLPEHPSLPGPGVLGKSPPSEQTSHQQAQKSSTQGSSRRPPLEFINSVLTEALTFADSTLDATFKPLSEKSASGSTAKVKLLKGEFSSEQTNAGLQSASSLRSTTTTKAPAETWFARRSRHENALRQGTATWDEFDHYLRDDHSETEKAYTPDIKYSHTALDWDPELKGKNVSNFSDIKMHITEMFYTMPVGLDPRVFSVLVITAKTASTQLDAASSSPQDFIVVQIPIDIRALPGAFFSNGKNLTEGTQSLEKKKPVLAIYTSVERAKLLGDNTIEWTMATASNAGGILPMWAQKLGVPPAIVKDVGLFFDLMATTRPAAAA